MDGIFLFSYVEDMPSREVLIKLVERHNQVGGRPLKFFQGFPEIKYGFGNIKTKCPAFVKMAASGQHTLILTDLDKNECPATLIREWFFPGRSGAPELPKQVLFRVVVREIEAWIMADRTAFAKLLGIPPANFDDAPESLPNPKEFLLNVIRRKARKQWVLDMLPTGKAGIGPEYNNNLCRFIKEHWSIDRACEKAPSLQRAVSALGRI